MNTGPTVISYYTGDDYYKLRADNLSKKMKEFGVDHFVVKHRDLGSYWKNTLQKPTFILDKMNELKCDVIWMDADTEIFSFPDSLRSWTSDILFASHTGGLDGMKASPIGLKYNERTIEFISEWSRCSKDKIDSNNIDFDHDVLKFEVMPKFAKRISVEILGKSGDYKNFTDGSVITNGISRSFNKTMQMLVVTDKNAARRALFDSLNITDYELS